MLNGAGGGGVKQGIRWFGLVFGLVLSKDAKQASKDKQPSRG